MKKWYINILVSRNCCIKVCTLSPMRFQSIVMAKEKLSIHGRKPDLEKCQDKELDK